MERRRVRLIDIKHGSPDQGRENFIYAQLIEAVTGERIIGATLDYILNAIETRNYVLVGDP